MYARSLISPSYKGTIRKIMGRGGGGMGEVQKNSCKGKLREKKNSAHRVALKKIHVLTFQFPRVIDMTNFFKISKLRFSAQRSARECEKKYSFCS